VGGVRETFTRPAEVVLRVLAQAGVGGGRDDGILEGPGPVHLNSLEAGQVAQGALRARVGIPPVGDDRGLAALLGAEAGHARAAADPIERVAGGLGPPLAAIAIDDDGPGLAGGIARGGPAAAEQGLALGLIRGRRAGRATP